MINSLMDPFKLNHLSTDLYLFYKCFHSTAAFGKWIKYIQSFFNVRWICFKGNLCAMCLTSMWTKYDWYDIWWNQLSQKDQQNYPKIAEICSTAYRKSGCFVEDLTVFLFQFRRILTTKALCTLIRVFHLTLFCSVIDIRWKKATVTV